MGAVISATEHDRATRGGAITRVAGWSSAHPWTALGLWVLEPAGGRALLQNRLLTDAHRAYAHSGDGDRRLANQAF